MVAELCVQLSRISQLGSGYAKNSSASTKVSRVRVTSGQSRLKSAISRFMASPFIAIERSFVRKLICRLMQRWISQAPEPPRFGDPKGFRSVGQVLPLVPGIERLALGSVSDGGADDKEGCGHFFLLQVFSFVIPGHRSAMNAESGD